MPHSTPSSLRGAHLVQIDQRRVQTDRVQRHDHRLWGHRFDPHPQSALAAWRPSPESPHRPEPRGRLALQGVGGRSRAPAVHDLLRHLAQQALRHLVPRRRCARVTSGETSVSRSYSRRPGTPPPSRRPSRARIAAPCPSQPNASMRAVAGQLAERRKPHRPPIRTKARAEHPRPALDRDAPLPVRTRAQNRERVVADGRPSGPPLGRELGRDPPVVDGDVRAGEAVDADARELATRPSDAGDGPS